MCIRDSVQAVVQRLPGLVREASCQLNARQGRPCTASGGGWVLPLEQALRGHPQCSAVVGGAGVGLTDRIESRAAFGLRRDVQQLINLVLAAFNLIQIQHDLQGNAQRLR